MDDAVAATNAALTVEVASGAPGRRPAPGQVTAFKVGFAYPEREVAMKVTQRLTDLLINENSRMRETAADQTSQFLQSQLADAERRLREQDQKLEAFRQRYAGRLPNQLDGNLQALQSTRMELQSLGDSIARDRDRKAVLERLHQGASQDLENVSVAPPTPATGQSADPNALSSGTATQRLAQARANLTQLELRLKPEHPDVKRAKSQIRELEQQAAAETANRPASGGETSTPRAVSPEQQSRRERLREQREEINSLGRQIATKEQQEAALRGRMADYQSRIESIPGIESEWNELTRDNNTLQETYKTLLGRSEESKISANLEHRQIGEQFRMLDAPRISSGAAGARRLQANAGGVVLGLVLGLAIIGFREFRDTQLPHRSRRVQRARAAGAGGGAVRADGRRPGPRSPSAARGVHDGRGGSRGRRRRGRLPAALEIHRLRAAGTDTRSSGRRTTAPPRRRSYGSNRQSTEPHIRRTDRDRDGPGGALRGRLRVAVVVRWWPVRGPSPASTPAAAPTAPGARGPMALFRGFNESLSGRIVSTPAAPPVLAERFRRLAASLHHAQLVDGLRTVMVTSADPGDGKTLTSANLALTLSESYRRQVLLIDADLRRPSLHDVFNVPERQRPQRRPEGAQRRAPERHQDLRHADAASGRPAGSRSDELADVDADGGDPPGGVAALRMDHRRHRAARPARRRQPAGAHGRQVAPGHPRRPDPARVGRARRQRARPRAHHRRRPQRRRSDGRRRGEVLLRAATPRRSDSPAVLPTREG